MKCSSDEGFISVFYIFSHKKIVYCLFFLKNSFFFFAGTLFVMDVTLTTAKYKYTHNL